MLKQSSIYTLAGNVDSMESSQQTKTAAHRLFPIYMAQNKQLLIILPVSLLWLSWSFCYLK